MNTKSESLDFSGQDLKNRDFSNRILIGADFSESDCSNCDFSKSDLSYANFRGAKLYRANFSQSILYVTSFKDCVLTRASFHKAFIYGIEFVGTVNVTYCDFSDPQLEVNRRKSSFPNDTSLYRSVDFSKISINQDIASTNSGTGFNFKNEFGSKLECNGHFIEFVEYGPFEKEMQLSQIYNRLKRIHKENNFYSESGEFYYWERYWETKSWFTQGSKEVFSIGSVVIRFAKTLGAKLNEVTTGYGEKPLRVVFWLLAGLLGFSIYYYFSSLLTYEVDVKNAIHEFFLAVYYSTVTLTGLGTSEIVPTGTAKLITIIESVFGVTMFSLFTATIVRKMIRD